MFKKPFLACLLSLLVPGLGQICAGKSRRGAAILIAVLIVGNLNAIWLSLHGLTSPENYWTHQLPLNLHDLFAVYGIIFWIWQVVDAYRQTRVFSIGESTKN